MRNLSVGAVEYIHCIAAEKIPIHPTRVLDIKPFDAEDQVLEFGGMWSTPSFPLLPGPLRPKSVAPDMILYMVQIKLFNI